MYQGEGERTVANKRAAFERLIRVIVNDIAAINGNIGRKIGK